jgi:cytochrome c oxidase subunit 3
MQKNPVINSNKETYTKIPTYKILLWLAMVSMVMMFAGLTSGYIVRQAEGNWLTFELPSVFYISTLLIAVSSITMFLAQKAIKDNKALKTTQYLVLTLLLGIGFCITQFIAWSELVDMGVFFTGNPSGSFLYVLTGMHFLHLAGGIIYLVVVSLGSGQGRYSAEKHLPIQLCAIFWHFLGGLWIYLFIFLLNLR